LGLDKEWSVDKESELLVQALSSILDRVAINNSPLLTESILLWMNNNRLHFSVLVSGNSQSKSVSSIDDVSANSFPLLPPITGDASRSNSSGATV